MGLGSAFSLKAWHKLSTAQQLTIITSIAPAIAAIASYTYSRKFGAETFYLVAVSLIISVSIEKLQRAFYEADMKEHMARLADKNADLEYIGDTRAAITWFSENFHGATLVYNTTFNRTNSAFDYMADEHARYERDIIRAIREKCTWCDIVLPGGETAVRAFHSKLGTSDRQRYRAVRIDTGLPLFECMTARFAGRDERPFVLFGYGPSTAQMSRVYRGHDPETVNYFQRYLGELARTGTRIDFSRPEPGQPAGSSPASTPP